MFIGGPIISGGACAWLLIQLEGHGTSGSIGLPLFILMFLGALEALIDCVFLIYGRTYRHVVNVQQRPKPREGDTLERSAVAGARDDATKGLTAE